MAIKVPVKIYDVEVITRSNKYNRECFADMFKESIRVDLMSSVLQRWERTNYTEENMPLANGLVRYEYD